MKNQESRREFLRGAGRYGLLGLLATAGALAVTRRGGDSGASCLNARRCQGCSVFARCALPDALAARQKATEETR